MKRIALATAACLAWLALFPSTACTSDDGHPPQLGDCPDASCQVAVVGGGTGGAMDSGAATCSVNAGNSQCGLCEVKQCCSVLESCVNDPSCKGLLDCENACVGAANCNSSCLAKYPQGQGGLNTVTACALAKCPVCSQLGVGDPCSTGTCNPGLSCEDDLWCTEPCLHSSDCVGLGPGGGNTLGLPNECLPTGTCYAGCTTNNDCLGIPGTFCNTVMSIEQIPVTVCQPMQDAAVTD